MSPKVAARSSLLTQANRNRHTDAWQEVKIVIEGTNGILCLLGKSKVKKTLHCVTRSGQNGQNKQQAFPKEQTLIVPRAGFANILTQS